MHGRTRSKKRRPRVQTRIEYFLLQGSKERGGGRVCFLASSSEAEFQEVRTLGRRRGGWISLVFGTSLSVLDFSEASELCP